jgi:hypothetical protein
VTTEKRDLPDLIDETKDDDRPSITETDGKVVRFEMSYSPPDEGARVKFHAPMRVRLPSLLYLALGLSIFGVVFAAYYGLSSSSFLFQWVVEGDRGRPIGSQVLATIVLVSAVATVIRAQMRGVVVSADWIEARYLLAMGIPKTKKWGWPQVHRVIVDKDAIAFELYDGSFEKLPAVAEPSKLRDHLLYYATKRRIQVTSLERAAGPQA